MEVWDMGGIMKNGLFAAVAIVFGLVLGCATKGVMPTENLTSPSFLVMKKTLCNWL
jgi:hypothetical protein